MINPRYKIEGTEEELASLRLRDVIHCELNSLTIMRPVWEIDGIDFVADRVLKAVESYLKEVT